MNIKMDDDQLSDTKNLTNNVNITINRYKNDPHTIAIFDLVTWKGNFSLSQVTYEKKEKFLRNLYMKKASKIQKLQQEF